MPEQKIEITAQTQCPDHIFCSADNSGWTNKSHSDLRSINFNSNLIAQLVIMAEQKSEFPKQIRAPQIGTVSDSKKLFAEQMKKSWAN